MFLARSGRLLPLSLPSPSSSLPRRRKEREDGMGLASLNAVGIPSRPRGGGDPNGAAPLDKKGVYEEGQKTKGW